MSVRTRFSSSALKVSFYTRGSKSAYLGVVDANTGDIRVVARDTGKTFVEISNPQDPGSFYVTKDMKDAFWWSERDGWGHLYRFDAAGVSSIASTADGQRCRSIQRCAPRVTPFAAENLSCGSMT